MNIERRIRNLFISLVCFFVCKNYFDNSLYNRFCSYTRTYAIQYVHLG